MENVPLIPWQYTQSSWSKRLKARPPVSQKALYVSSDVLQGTQGCNMCPFVEGFKGNANVITIHMHSIHFIFYISAFLVPFTTETYDCTVQLCSYVRGQLQEQNSGKGTERAKAFTEKIRCSNKMMTKTVA